MPLSATDQPGVVDAFGVHFDMTDRGEPVRCHVFTSAIVTAEDCSTRPDELLSAFQRSRKLFEREASTLYDAGHRTPWIETFGPISRMLADE